MMTDQDLQTLRNMGNESEAAADEIERLRLMVTWAYGKLHDRDFRRQDDALMLDEMKLLLEHGI